MNSEDYHYMIAEVKRLKEVLAHFQAEADARAERSDLGYWGGEEWCYSCTNHAVFEFPDDETDNGKPTHWMPLPASPGKVPDL